MIEDRVIAERTRGGLGGRVASSLAVLAVLGTALVGGNAFGLRQRLLGSRLPTPRPEAVSRVAGAPGATVKPEKTVLRSQPWWQSVRTMEGRGASMTPAFRISDGAVQWRVKSTCESGRLVVRAPSRARPILSAGCPASEMGYATEKGRIRLDVTADGPWKLEVEQQIDVPLVEPPLPAMTAPGATVVTTGSFYRIDQFGEGRVDIYRLADGGYALRLEGFYVTPNVDLEIRLSTLPAPRTTEEFLSAPSDLVSRLDITAGSLNFAVPGNIDPTKFRSVVIWCPPVRSAYSAATMTPAR